MSQHLTPQDKQTVEASAAAIRHIDALARNESFLAFLERFQREADAMADSILHDESLTPEEREKMRVHRLGILDVLKAPQERDVHERILDGFGVGPGHPED